MSSGEIELFPGKKFKATDLVTYADLNAVVGQLTLRIKAGAVTARELADGSIPADKVSADFSAQLGVPDGAVTTAKLVDGAVTTAKLADEAVTHNKASPDLIHGQTLLPAPIASDDEMLIYREVDGKLYRIEASALAAIGSVIQSVTATNVTPAAITTVIPFDDTKPQITEGTEILSATITPTRATSKVRVRFCFSLGRYTNTNPVVTAALFNGSADAIYATFQNLDPLAGVIFGEYIDAPATTSAKTYSLRVGAHYAITMWINGYYTGAPRALGGASVASLTLEEIKGE